MAHENRAGRNHRGLAARAATVASEMPRRTTAVVVAKPKATEKVVPKVTPTVIRATRPLPKTTSAVVVEPSVPTTPASVATIPTPSPPVIPTTSLPVVPTPTPTSISTTTSVPVQYLTVTTVKNAKTASHASSSQKTVPQATNAVSGGTSTVSGGAVAGAVIGGLAGLALIAAVVFFLVRRYRKSSTESWAFNAAKFRRSALLLDDTPSRPEKNMQQQQRGPRPPSMIARHMNSPAVPQASATGPYGEHAVHSADPYGQYAAGAAQYNVGMYGADGQVIRDPYADVYGGNPSYGQHAPYGQPAFGAPPTQLQFPQRQQAFTPQPYNQQFPAQHTFQSSIGSAESAHSHNHNHNTAPLPNPFAQSTTTAAAALSAAHTAARASSPSSSNSHSHSGSDVGSSEGSTTSPAVLHRRQPTQAGGAPPAYEEDPSYANMQRDVKVSPGTLAVVNSANDASSSAGASRSTPATPTTPSKRPMSSYTVYDPADAYGGI
ncbi:hypothetical protein DXG01_015288 [Tephrocybe rancida]|nr:hypothetical protein DXG01_015288 [Tephrocybe rancida]